VGVTLIGMNRGLETFRELKRPVDINHLPSGVTKDNTGFDREHITVTQEGGQTEQRPAKNYVLLNALGSSEIPDGKYLYNQPGGQIEVQWIQGIGSERAAAPQARLMSVVINGILSQRLPWRLVLMGVFLVVAVELLGIRSLSFAVGSYLSIATTMAIFAGGLTRWLIERAARKAGEVPVESEVSPGSLYASGLIAAGGIVGLIGVALKLVESRNWIKENAFTLHVLDKSPVLGGFIAVVTFIALAWSLFHFARKPLETVEPEKK
jgi:hypothetical protein